MCQRINGSILKFTPLRLHGGFINDIHVQELILQQADYFPFKLHVLNRIRDERGCNWEGSVHGDVVLTKYSCQSNYQALL